MTHSVNVWSQGPWRSAWETTEQALKGPPPPPPAISRSTSSSSSHQQPTKSTAESISNSGTPVAAAQLQQESLAGQPKQAKGTRPLIWLKSPNKAPAVPSPPAARPSQPSRHSSPCSVPLLASNSDPIPYALSPNLDPQSIGSGLFLGAASGFGLCSVSPEGLPDGYSSQHSALPSISLARPSASSEEATPDQSSQISRCVNSGSLALPCKVGADELGHSVVFKAQGLTMSFVSWWYGVGSMVWKVCNSPPFVTSCREHYQADSCEQSVHPVDHNMRNGHHALQVNEPG